MVLMTVLIYDCYHIAVQCEFMIFWVHTMQQIDGMMQPAGCEEQLGSCVLGTYQKSPLRRNSGLG